MELKEETLSSEVLYRGRVVTLKKDRVRLENGVEAAREVVCHPGGVSAAALTPDNRIYLVRQFRYPYKQVVLETPAGKLEPGEDPDEAIRRELREETGVTADDFLKLGDFYPTPGYTDEIIRLYACRAQSQGATDFDDDEFLEVETLPIGEAVQMVMDNRIPDGKSQALILRTALLVQAGKL